MRGGDARGKCVALVPDCLLNAHLSDYDDLHPEDWAPALEILEEIGYGIIQMPAHTLPVARLPLWIQLAVDQIEEYGKNAYTVVLLEIPELPGAGVWKDHLLAELRQRNLFQPPIYSLQRLGDDAVKKRAVELWLRQHSENQTAKLSEA